MQEPHQPYGPATDVVRRFLVRLAALDRDTHDDIVRRYDTLHVQASYREADVVLGVAIERSDRAYARDALAGPFVQMMQRPARDGAAGMDPAELDVIAEAALAALLALVVVDVLPHGTLQTLYAPFDAVVPLASLRSATV